MNSPAAAKLIVSQLETALKALAKLLVSIKFYPPNHPSLQDVTSDARSGFDPLLQDRESVSIVVRRTGFFYEEEPVASTNTMLQKLAANLFARRIQRLLFLRGLSSRDLWETAKILLLDVDVIQKQGGMQALLQQAKVTTLWVNAVDIQSIFEMKNKLEEEKSTLAGDAAEGAPISSPAETDAVDLSDAVSPSPEEEAGAADAEFSFEELLDKVEKASGPQEFSMLLQRLIPVALGNLTDKSAHLVLRTLSFLAQSCEGRSASEEMRKASGHALAQMSTPPLLRFYVDLLCARIRFDSDRITWDTITRTLGSSLSKFMLTRLAAEEDPTARKVLFEALVSQGDIALATIVGTLKSENWPLLRNGIQLLGEIRDPAAIEPLRALLQHRDLRVRREVLRALTRIGGNTVIAIIARILHGDDSELRRQAMLGLGAIKNPTTIPLLIQFIRIKDWRFLQLEAKIDAVRTLGEIGSDEALPELLAIATHRCLFYRSRNDFLRAAALLAIGEIGGPEAVEFLEGLEGETNPVVEKAVNSALKQAKRGGVV